MDAAHFTPAYRSRLLDSDIGPVVWPLLALLYALPAVHPLLRPLLGEPSHLLWWVHVLPVAYLAFTFGGRGAALAIGGSGLWVVMGERMFGAGYGTSADLATLVSIPTALVATELMVGAFALWIRRAEETLREREHLYRDLFEDAPVPYFSVGMDGRILRLNREAERMLGRRGSELVGQPVVSLYADSPEGKPRALELFRRFSKGEDIRNEELEMAHPGGESLWVRLQVRARRDSQGNVVESRSVPLDVTDRRKAEAEVERLAAFPRQNPSPVMELAAGGIVQFANEACWQAVRRIGGEGPGDLLPAHVDSIVLECLESGIGQADVRVTLEDRILAWVFQPVASTDVVHAYASDVTALDEDLRHLQKMESVARLSAGIAHDFNNTLTVILSNCGLLDTALPQEDEARQCLDDIRSSAMQGAGLVSRLLAFSRRERLELTAVDPEVVIRSLEPTFRLLLREQNEVLVEVEAGLPRIRGDQGAIGQILVNLVSNAAAASAAGEPIRVRAETRNDQTLPGEIGAHRGGVAHVVISVSDRGHGIPFELQKKVFEPFFTTRPPGGGTGLGLAMVDGLMHQHGGWVRLESEPGRGTRVSLIFPGLQGAEGWTEVDGGPVATESEGVRKTGESVLVVEDEEALRRSMARTLERLGYKVVTSADGKEALAWLTEAKGEVDLVLTDIVMPRMGGLELFQRARAHWPRLPFLFTSGYSATEWGDGVESRKDLPILKKPWTIEELAGAVRGVLDR